MNNKNILLIAGILSLLIFVGFLSESAAQTIFGYSISVWYYRVAWLLLTIAFLYNYNTLRKAENEKSKS